jgi:hypothetical protein
MKSMREYTPVTLIFQSQKELDLMLNLADHYDQIGDILGGKYRDFLIDVADCLTEDNILESIHLKKGTFDPKEFKQIADPTFFSDGVKFD